jgi:predicted transcriptional regulator
MPFEITVVSNVPLTPLKQLDEVALAFLGHIGYIPKGYDPKTGALDIRSSVPYRLFVECFLGRIDRGWTVDQLSAKLGTTKATVYRQINKLTALDLLEESEIMDRGQGHKGYRIRYGDLAKAWNFVEAHVEVAMENYRTTVEHLQALAQGRD